MRALHVLGVLLVLPCFCLRGPAAERGVVRSESALERKTHSLIIPKIDVDEITIQDFVDLLRDETRKQDPDHTGVNFFLRFDPNREQEIKQRQVTLSFTNLPVEEIVRYLCLATGLKYRIEASAVVIADDSVALDKMETRIYLLAPGVLDAKRTRKKVKSIEWKSGSSSSGSDQGE